MPQRLISGPTSLFSLWSRHVFRYFSGGTSREVLRFMERNRSVGAKDNFDSFGEQMASRTAGRRTTKTRSNCTGTTGRVDFSATEQNPN